MKGKSGSDSESSIVVMLYFLFACKKKVYHTEAFLCIIRMATKIVEKSSTK